MELTQKQLAIFKYIEKEVELSGRPPTLREIGKKFNINSTNGVRSFLDALVKKGVIVREAKKSRAIRLARPSQSRHQDGHFDILEIPILGRVAAGLPTLAVENIEGTLKVSSDLVQTGNRIFALRIKGDSMKQAGILENDLILARVQNTANNGDIVVALLDEEATVKRFFLKKGKVFLYPENQDYSPIVINNNYSDFSILGKVITVIRKY
jgi:repressor LexA